MFGEFQVCFAFEGLNYRSIREVCSFLLMLCQPGHRFNKSRFADLISIN